MSQSDEPAAARRRGKAAAGTDPAKRAQILDGARSVFARLGFDAASMNDITREASVSKSTIYVYFASKEDLFEALISETRERLFAEVRAELDRPGPVAEVLHHYGLHLAEVLCSEPVIAAHRTVIGVTERKPELGRRFYDGGARRGMEAMRGYLQQQVAAGMLDIPDTCLAAYQFIDLCLAGLFRRRLLAHLEEPPAAEELDKVVSAAVTMFLRCYGRSPGADS
ncbi:TetR/AcrR family transcriptional regulator [Mangrovicoccus algicola]|uniref:TetR/AcrR family transcriptional regulator n=1 Tax=Mangrovicoccus algicola TaxID=2771008 RepID=A0A8J6YYX1_9RHOB|nr:TetR/AcrR family transcriptional regulator [Mangrovicoccus algicola]MBE3640357.1 TetR/AcrR family transcriptional regulator [Mangrovicoccus algicola]